jgi:hypothetical protein
MSATALISACENWRPTAAPICATSRTGARRSSRASSEAFSEFGIASAGNGPAAVYRAPASVSTPLSTTALVSSSMKAVGAGKDLLQHLPGQRLAACHLRDQRCSFVLADAPERNVGHMRIARPR